MGPQRVLQAVAVVAGLIASGLTGGAARAQSARERIAIIDLGDTARPDGGGARRTGFADPRRRIVDAIVAGGFAELTGDGLDAALAGRDVDLDALEIDAALATARRAFGELACAEVVPAANTAIGWLAARQAAGLATPELGRALSYLLLCADRDGRTDTAQAAAAQLRSVGGSPDVPAAMWTKYPDVDAVANRELIDLTIDSDVPGAEIWVDFQRLGVGPQRVALAAGPHVLAAAGGGKRGSAFGTAVRSQPTISLALRDPTGVWHDVAARVASWHGAVPPPAELAWLLGRVHARIALIRHGDTVEAWGQIGRGEPPRPIGGEDHSASLTDVDRGELDRLLGLVAERIAAWDSHAPDPDRPLLVESSEPRRGGRQDAAEAPTRWWVYAAIAGAAVVGASVIYLHDSAHDVQRVELHVP